MIGYKCCSDCTERYSACQDTCIKKVAYDLAHLDNKQSSDIYNSYIKGKKKCKHQKPPKAFKDKTHKK